ncbi:hypothetical protein ADIARSV_0165 [Arcticibacter svalbardensis MN12-7]|uniref:Uncharacterized protein n=1 Tax=Arcticibacter svalbardensis MN12-7 TaxID=1150600 RepID=R9GXX7_9SPHI|nr:hypothetical protein [Arcticibacter svalbardensis]EOR96642.1 hypothetical protein ADIARSV_0165 [Arcticibacter svalbardensis MN12-7]
MKKLLVFPIFLLFVTSGFAQKWKPVHIDDSVQVSLPGEFTKKDTLGQILFNSESSFGEIMITKQPDNSISTPDIEKVKHLKIYYDDFIKRIKTSSNGIVSDERDTVIGKLQVKDFKLEIDSGSGKQYRMIRILHENSSTYTFQFLYKAIHEEYAKGESDTFFNSITIPPSAAVSTQFTDPENTTGKAPVNDSRIYLIIGAVVVIVLIIVIIILRKRRKRY